MRVKKNEMPAGPWLLADMGGTNARFGWVSAQATAAPVVEAVMTLPTADHGGPAQAASVYLDRLQTQLGSRYQAPAAAAFAVATAVVGDQVALTNSGWNFSRRDCQQALGLSTLLVLNDFEALALSLPGLRPEQLRRGPVAGTGALTDDFSDSAGAPGGAWLPLAVIGPGTGLGVAGIVPRLGDRFFASAFRQRFEAKGRFQPYLQAIPTAVITDTLAALGGAAQALLQHRS